LQHVDAIVVGGGPAGSTCAWKLRQAGMDVLVLDRSEFPRTKLCAGWITPQVVDDLELNVSEYPHSFLSFDRLELNWRRLRLSKKTVQHSIRRYEFDEYLLQRSGAPVQTHKVKSFGSDGKRIVVDGLFSCDYLVGAGGTSCPVYRHFFHERNPRAKDLQIATYEHEFPYDWQDDECKLWFSEDGLPGYAWYVPKGRGYINIGLGGKADAMKSKSLRLQDHWDRFVRNLEQRGLVTGAEYDPTGYSYYLRGSVDTVRLGNVFIAGDAVGLASKDLGEGIGPAVRSAILAAKAIVEKAEYSLKNVEGYSVPGFIQQRILKRAASL
jgi:menaquinone-9 beta-reductase